MKINHTALITGDYQSFNSELNDLIKKLNASTSVNEIIDIKFTTNEWRITALILLNVNESYFDNE